MAAVTAADCGKRILLLEKNDRIGKKLLITGKGRCNVTNCCTTDEFMENIVNGGRFLYSSYSAFDCSDTMNFFEDLGVPLKVERGNRVFPVSDKAADIAAAFERAIKAPHRRELITLKTNLAADSIVTENGCIKGVMERGSF